LNAYSFTAGPSIPTDPRSDSRRPFRRMANKRERQLAIHEIVGSKAVHSQDELRRLLRQRGWDVTQSTLSRDLHELRLARIPTEDGVRYAFTDGSAAAVEDDRGALDHLLPQLFDKVDGTGELVVLHTVTGGAQPVAAAIDSEAWPDVLGTIAGDDTILLVCRSVDARSRVMRRLSSLAGERA
jgi:transcriptional regulator of arginine metabolism